MMRKLMFITFSLIAVVIISSCSGNSQRSAKVVETLEPGEIPSDAVAWQINPQSSQISWMASKVTGQHNGTIEIGGGDVYVYDGAPVGGTVEMNMEEIVVLDITDPQMNANLTGHLKSDDFFSVESYPASTFQFLSFEPLDTPDQEGNNYKVTGNLSIKDITHTIAFNANIVKEDGQLLARADFDLDRTLWDIRFRSGKFFENLGDNLIHDNFNLQLHVVAVQ